MVHKNVDRNEKIVTPEGRLCFPARVASTVEGKSEKKGSEAALDCRESLLQGASFLSLFLKSLLSSLMGTSGLTFA